MTPQAQWVPLHGLGHCPMLDDAGLTTRTILEFTQRVDAGDGARRDETWCMLARLVPVATSVVHGCPKGFEGAGRACGT